MLSVLLDYALNHLLIHKITPTAPHNLLPDNSFYHILLITLSSLILTTWTYPLSILLSNLTQALFHTTQISYYYIGTNIYLYNLHSPPILKHSFFLADIFISPPTFLLYTPPPFTREYVINSFIPVWTTPCHLYLMSHWYRVRKDEA